ncbi:MAG: energy transducer TonB [Bacteroidales bacterium]|nr:energy transducer TonB [Bacteroidales bacterium]
MELKKSPKADLEKTRFLFLEIGFVIALATIVIAFEWTTEDSSFNEYDSVLTDVFEEEVIPVTIQKEQKNVVPPEPVRTIEIFEIVNNDIEIDDEIHLQDFEINQDSEIEIIQYLPQEEEVEEEEAEIFFIVEDMPSFGGPGQDGFREYIANNLDYPQTAAENGISGRVFVNFVVEPDGSVSHVTLLRGIDPALDNEAIRVVKSSPKWSPGKQRGKPVRVLFTFPINFQLLSASKNVD